MVSGSLALLYFLLGFHGGGRAAAPIGGKVEWADFLSVRLSVRSSIRPSVSPSGPSSQALGPASQV